MVYTEALKTDSHVELLKFNQRRSEGGAGGAGRTRRHLLGGGKLAKIGI